MADCLVVFSGGMDSTVLLADSITRYATVAALSFDYGSKHNGRELPLAKATCARLGVAHRLIELPFINQLFSSTLLTSGDEIPEGAYDAPTMQSTIVPFRNGIMLSIAAGYAESIGASTVLLGSHAGDHFIYPDCRPAFNQAFAEAVTLGTDEKVAIDFPFAMLDKREIGDRGRELGVDFGATWTFYKWSATHCGVFGACNERNFALRHDQGLDPTTYQA